MMTDKEKILDFAQRQTRFNPQEARMVITKISTWDGQGDPRDWLYDNEDNPNYVRIFMGYINDALSNL